MLDRNKFPKIIHQIWMQGEDNIPQKFVPFIESIKQNHKTWQYKLWDEIQILVLLRSLKKEYKIWHDVYYKFNYLHQKVDFARYIILYIYGGIYIDIDVRSIKSLDPLINKYQQYNLIISESNSSLLSNYILCGRTNCVNNGILISVPANIILLRFINTIITIININEDKIMGTCGVLSNKMSCINNTTGPKKFKDILENENKDSEYIVLDKEYMEPCRDGNCNITNNTYLAHVHSQTWFYKGIYQYFKKFINIFYYVFIYYLIVMVILFFVITIYKLNWF
jgi:inositol phosphorylceramide mannosyltransferase catalytic subunit